MKFRPGKTLEPHIRKALHEYLGRTLIGSSEAVLIDELGISRRDGFIDVAVVNSHLHAYEIKSEADSLDRLPRQIKLYGQVMDYLSVAVAENHLSGVKKKLPKWWGIYLFDKQRRAIEEVRAPSPNEETNVIYLSELLWRKQAMAMLEKKGAERGMKSKPKAALWQKIIELYTHEEVHSAVVQQFKTHRRREYNYT